MTIEELFDEVLRLPKKDRARLAGQILESLDGSASGPNVEEVWNQEIERRLADGDEAYEPARTVEEIQQEMMTTLKKARAT